MSVTKRTALGFVFALASGPLQTEPVSYGALSSNDDGTTEIIVDHLNGYEWLRWDVLGLLTYEQTLTAIAPGGPYEGWSIAGEAEAQQFVDALFYPGADACDASSVFERCGYTEAALTPLLGDSFVVNTPETYDTWSDAAFFLTANETERQVGFLEHYNEPSHHVFVMLLANGAGSIEWADRYPLSGAPVPWLLYRRSLGPADLLQRLVTSVVEGGAEILANRAALAQVYYAAPDLPATCALLQDFFNEVQADGAKLTTAQAEAWARDALVLMLAIGC
jgi:hypothetical protein